MATLTSPGISITETDITNTTPAVSTSVGGFVGHFAWGPADEIVTVSSEKQLGETFSVPTRKNDELSGSFLTAASFLKYGNSLRVMRSVASDANNANSEGADVLIKNKTQFETISDGSLPLVVARCPGQPGNSVQVQFIYGDVADFNTVSLIKQSFDGPSGTSLFAEQYGVANDEIHVLVIDSLGLLSGTKGAILEKYSNLSLASDATGEGGASIYYRDVINTNSSYVYLGSSLSAENIITNADTDLSDLTTPIAYVFVAGANGVNATVTHSSVLTTKTNITDAANVILSTTTTVTKPVVKFVTKYKTPFTAGNNARLTFLYLGADSVVAEALYPAEISAISTDIANAQTNYTLSFYGNTTLKNIADAISRADDADWINGDASDLPNQDDLNYRLGLTVDGVYLINPNYPGENNSIETYYATLSDSKKVIFDVHSKALLYNAQETPLGTSPETYAPSEVVDTPRTVNFSGAADSSFGIKNVPLTGGANGIATNAASIVATLGVISTIDADILDINFLFTENLFDVAQQELIDASIFEIVEARRNIIGFISAPLTMSALTSDTDKKNAVSTKFSGIGSTSFLVFDSTPVYTYNKYTDRYQWIAAAGHMAGLCANTDFVAEPWFSPAGFNRGQLRGVTKLAYNPNQPDRDDLYKNRINPIVSFPGQGILLFGDKTALSKPSAFDRINVRRLFNNLERTISIASKFQLFEINDEFTRSSFVNTIEPFLRNIKGRRGITDYKVVCDATNNTGDVIDANKFVASIFIKPVRSINFISLNFIATRTGIDFNEIAGV